MPALIEAPTIIRAAGSLAKQIEEYVGQARTGSSALSIARMVSPGGWAEPGQRPEFDEYTLVLTGTLVAETDKGAISVLAGQALVVSAGEWVRYSTPSSGGAEYISVCVPAFTPDIVHRDPVT